MSIRNFKILTGLLQKPIKVAAIANTALLVSTTLPLSAFLPRLTDSQQRSSRSLRDTAIAALQKDPGNSPTTATKITLGSTTTSFTDSISNSDLDDYYQFTLDKDSTVTLSLTSQDNKADIEVRNSNGEIVENSEYGDSTGEPITLHLSPGTYNILVGHIGDRGERPKNNRGKTNYELKVSVTQEDIRKITLGPTNTVFTDSISNSDLDDPYQFTLDKDSTVNLILTSQSGEADIEVRDSKGEIVENSEVGDSTKDQPINLVLPAGTYNILVGHIGDRGERTEKNQGKTNYDLTVSATPVGGSASDTLKDAQDLGTLSERKEIRDFVGDTNPDDYYRFELGADSVVNLGIAGLSQNADVSLVQDRNNNGKIESPEGELLYSSFNPGTDNDNLEVSLTAGTYYIWVHQPYTYNGIPVAPSGGLRVNVNGIWVDTPSGTRVSGLKPDGESGVNPARLSGVNTNYVLLAKTEYTVSKDQAGNDYKTARDLGTLEEGTQTFNDFVGNIDPDDFYVFRIKPSHNLSLQLDGLNARANVLKASANLVVYYDKGLSFGEERARSAKPGPEAEQISFFPPNRPLLPGRYYISVARGADTLNTNYNLKVTSKYVQLPAPKQIPAPKQTSARPYAVLVNGYYDCCVWDPKRQGYYHMAAVVQGLYDQGLQDKDIRRVPWDHFSDGKGQLGGLSDDKAFLDGATQFINNELDPSRPLILIGHSYGGDSLLSLAPRIKRRILFLGVIDPVAAGGFREPIQRRGVPSNVGYFFNRWETNRLDGIPIVQAKNAVPFDSVLNGTVAGCRARVCDQQEQNLAREADGSEKRVSCRPLEATCKGWRLPGCNFRGCWKGSNGTKAQRLFHEPMPSDPYIQRQMVDIIKKEVKEVEVIPPPPPPSTSINFCNGHEKQGTVLHAAYASSDEKIGWQAHGWVTIPYGECTKVDLGRPYDGDFYIYAKDDSGTPFLGRETDELELFCVPSSTTQQFNSPQEDLGLGSSSCSGDNKQVWMKWLKIGEGQTPIIFGDKSRLK